jgi:hypothetical protein
MVTFQSLFNDFTQGLLYIIISGIILDLVFTLDFSNNAFVPEALINLIRILAPGVSDISKLFLDIIYAILYTGLRVK